MLRFVASEVEAGQRLDQALTTLLGIPRSQVQRWIDLGAVRVAGTVPRASRRLQDGESIEVEPPELVSADVLPEAIELDVLHEDADVIVIDKPAGLVVHPAPGHWSGTLVNALLHHCGDLAGIGGVLRPGIVHRLDRGTSGVLVAAKNDLAHHSLAEQFRAHTVERRYLALVRGTPAADTGRVSSAIGRHSRDRKRMSVRTRAGRDALTNWCVRERFPHADRSLIEVRPETGRTHQIRVHLASVGLPLVADTTYGRGRSDLGLARPALHAAVLGFDHPRDGARVRFETPPPADFAEALARLARMESRR